MKQLLLSLFGSTIFFAGVATTVLADSIQLKNGSVLQGKWLNKDDKSAAEWMIELDDGTQVVLPRNDVKGILPQVELLETYASNLEKVDDSVETHRKIVEWCLKNSLNGMADAHRERIVELDPDDKATWAAMGYLRTSEGWQPKEQVQRQRGLIAKGNKWYLPHDLAIIEAGEAAKVQRAEVEKKVVKAIADLRTNNSKADEARRYLQELRDPLAVPKLRDLLVKDRSKTNSASRRELIEIIARIPAVEAVSTLVDSALEDPDDALRAECVEYLEKIGPRKELAVQMLMARLVNSQPRTDNPRIYDRAGQALAVLGDERCLARLMDCLVSKHIVTSKPGNQYNVGQTSDGNVGMSQGKPKDIEVQSQNQGVLGALAELTGENFGFDTESWREWWANKYAPPNAYVVRDP
jgi:hypothetical protein